MKRWLWVIVLGSLAAAGIYWGMRPQPVAVEMAKVETKPLRVTVEEEGKTRLRSRYVVMAPVAGNMPRLKWKEGDSVKAGALVTMIEAPRPLVLDARTREQAEARVRTAEAALRAAESRVAAQREQVRLAKTDLEYWTLQRGREEKLHGSGDLPASRLDRTVAEVRRGEVAVAAAERNVAAMLADVETAKAEVATAKASLRQAGPSAGGERMAVSAPSGGRVIKVLRESEGVVQAGEALLEIGDARAIEVVIEALSADAVKVSPGMKVLLERWGGPVTLEARVRVVEPGGYTKVSALGVEEQRVRVIADLVSPAEQWAALGDGYRVEAAFVLWEGEKVLQVPSNAIFRVNGSWGVFVVEEGIARRREVETGHRSGLAVEIVKGLKEGDVVILHPDETVEEGKLVADGKP